MEVISIRRLFLLLPFLSMLILSGCQNAFGYINARWIDAIDLIDMREEREEHAGNKAERALATSFSEQAVLKTIAEAMNKSSRLKEDLSYNKEFKLRLAYGDGYAEEYELALGSEKGTKGLLVPAADTRRGYSIPVKHADKLRDLIFGVTGQTEAGTPAARSAQSVSVIREPVTLSRNELFPVTGRQEYLNLRLVQGQYSEDWATPEPFGRWWSGTFELTVTDAEGKVLSTFPLSGHFREELGFGDFFPIQFGDYNGDGQPDFTIGQVASQHGSFYKLFTLNQDHTLAELTLSPEQELLISSPERYSAKLERAGSKSFKARYYDSAKGQEVEALYQWDGGKFQRVNQ